MRKVMFRIAKLAPVGSVAVALLFFAGPAGAQVRRCEENPAISGRICTELECITYQDQVHAPDSCSSRANPLRGCDKITGCFNLKQARQRWLRCYETRNRINKLCWDNQDWDHLNEAAIAIGKVFECNAKIAKECDECPW